MNYKTETRKVIKLREITKADYFDFIKNTPLETGAIEKIVPIDFLYNFFCNQFFKMSCGNVLTEKGKSDAAQIKIDFEKAMKELDSDTFVIF